jgi:hypothetical protein
MRRRARVYQFTPQDLTDWPCPPPRIEPMPQRSHDLQPAAGLFVALLLGAAFWALLLIPAWAWGLL